MSFLDLSALGLVTSATELANLSIGYLQAQIVGYSPSPGNMEVIQAEALALITADLEQTALVVPSAIWRAFGTKLVGVPYINGASAQTQVVFTVADTAGYLIPAGTGVTLNTYGFTTVSDLTIPSGMNTGAVTVAAVAAGTIYNGAFTPAVLVSQITVPVTGVAVLTPAYGGLDQEIDSAYDDRLVGELSLQAPRPITAGDYQLMALSFPPAPGTDQQEIARAVAIDGYNPATTAFTANTNSTTTLAVVSSFAGVSASSGGQPGSIITGSGIPAGTTVVSVNTGASTLVMSQAATATASTVSLSSIGSYGNPRMVGLWVALADGTAPNSDTLTAVKAWFQGYREVNFIVNVLSATYTPVYVTTSARLYPTADPTSTALAVQAAIMNFLSPPVWGQPVFGNRPQWFNQPYVRYSKLIAVIENVSGVDYVPPGTLEVGLSASPSGTTDLALPGPAPVATSTTTTVPLPTLV